MTSNTVKQDCDHANRRKQLINSPTTVGYSLASVSNLDEYLKNVIVEVETCIAGDYETHICKNCKEVIYARMHR